MQRKSKTRIHEDICMCSMPLDPRIKHKDIFQVSVYVHSHRKEGVLGYTSQRTCLLPRPWKNLYLNIHALTLIECSGINIQRHSCEPSPDLLQNLCLIRATQALPELDLLLEKTCRILTHKEDATVQEMHRILANLTSLELPPSNCQQQ